MTFDIPSRSGCLPRMREGCRVSRMSLGCVQNDPAGAGSLKLTKTLTSYAFCRRQHCHDDYRRGRQYFYRHFHDYRNTADLELAAGRPIRLMLLNRRRWRLTAASRRSPALCRNRILRVTGQMTDSLNADFKFWCLKIVSES